MNSRTSGNKKTYISLETLNLHNQTHNDIKPQNFLVKFKNGPNDLTQIEIALTDFGMARPESQGGTPVFASPECFEKKEKKSDIFSFGRVILFLLLTKNQFSRWLFVPIKDQTRILSLQNLTNPVLNPISTIWKRIGQTLNLTTNFEQSLILISQMTSMTDRVSLESARKLFNRIRKNSKIKLSRTLVSRIDMIINNELSSDMQVYVTELCDLRLVTTHY